MRRYKSPQQNPQQSHDLTFIDVAVVSRPPCFETKARKKNFGLETEATSKDQLRH